MNNQIFFTFYSLAHHSFFYDSLIVFFAQTFPKIVIVLSIVFLFYHHEVLPFKKSQNDKGIWDSFKILKQKWKEIVLVFFSGIFAWILSQILKMVFHTARPFDVFPSVHALISETGFAFPSGHATFYMALGMAIFFNHKKTGYLYMFFAVLIGLTRIVAGVHFPIDILGGFILGAIIAYFVRVIYDKIFNK